MRELDADSILRPDALTANQNYGAADLSKPAAPATCSARWCRSRVGWITVEPAMILALVSEDLHGPLATQYLWERISQDLGYNGSKTSECSDGSPDPLQKVQGL